MTKNLDGFELGLASQKIYDFIWSEYCDWYIEIAKSRLYGENEMEKATVSAVLVHVLKASLKLLHPFMPFITEEIFTKLTDEPTIMLSSWPIQDARFDAFSGDCVRMERLMELVRAIRNLRAEMKVPPSQRITARLIVGNQDAEAYGSMAVYLNKLAGVENATVSTEAGDIPKNDVHIVCEGVEAVIPLSSLVDPEKERTRIEKEIERFNEDIARAKAKLENQGFLAKAPQAVVDEEKTKLKSAEEKRNKLRERLETLV